MFRFQLEAAGFLASSAALSALSLTFKRKETRGKIYLPLDEDEDFGHDPFDVTTQTDLVDGYPIEEIEFWETARRRKIIITILLSFTVGLNASALGLSLASEGRSDVAVEVLQLFFALYLVIMSSRSVEAGSKSHATSMIHITSLTALGSLLPFTVAILPDTPPPAIALYESSTGIWYSLIILYTLACLVGMTTPLGPPLHYPPEHVYSDKTVTAITNPDPVNVCGIVGASIWGTLTFSYTTKVVWLGYVSKSLNIGDLPILSKNMRATLNFALMRVGLRRFQPRIFKWKPRRASGWGLAYKLARLNVYSLTVEVILTAISAGLSYAPAFFLRRFILYLESDPKRENPGWGWVYVFGLFMATTISYFVTDQMWNVATTDVEVRLRIQLNTSLFAKTLVRKDVASSAASTSSSKDPTQAKGEKEGSGDESDGFSSKAQVMTLMTTDVDRVSDFAWHLFYLVNSPVKILVGTFMLHSLLGVSCFFGLAVVLLFQPLNHVAGKTFVDVEENLMKARDERTALMNEILGAMRMLKFMAWERSFEKKVLKVREKELKYQARHYRIETLWNIIWNGSPILVTLVAFWHYAVVRQQQLTPSIAFTSIIVFSEMKNALNVLPETFINMIQCFVSLRRVEKYLDGSEVKPVPPLAEQSTEIAFQSCTVTWPQDRSQSGTASSTPSAVSTPHHKFILVDLNLRFPRGELSLVCGKLGSGKTLLLLSLLGEADILSGQVVCPHSPPDALATYTKAEIASEDWVVDGMCAYVPQAAWLRNATIKENILFSLPFNQKRYRMTLEACALTSDLEILEDGDESEIGERGVNLSGGQKARVSLARALYSRASILFLDDVLSAVDAHTAHHLFHQCLKGELMQGRTVILVSHHVQLCSSGASYIVMLDKGRVTHEGNREGFVSTGIIKKLGQSQKDDLEEQHRVEVEDVVLAHEDRSQSSFIVVAPSIQPEKDKKPPRKLVEEEIRGVGRIKKDIWLTFLKACGGYWYWILFGIFFGFASGAPVLENGWLKYWSGAAQEAERDSPTFYIAVYAGITTVGVLLSTARWFVLYNGSIRASTVLYQRLLEAVLFADIRFHDTVSRGRLLNRFGKDFEGIDSSLADNFGRMIITALSAVTAIVTVSFVGGPPFVPIILLLGILYYNAAKIYGQTSRDMRRLDSVSRSPLYSIYGETISGVPVLRAFGASSKLLRDMLQCVDTNTNPYYWLWGLNRWLSIRFNLLSSLIMGAAGLACLMTPNISASLAGFALAFASTITYDLLYTVRRFVGLEQSMVALERVKEYSELKREPAEFIEPRPAAAWPSKGEIKVEDLVIRYAPDLPDVLHKLSFTVHPGEKVGILGRTGSGKSTLALSLFRFVEPTQGHILVDDVDITTVGLTDLRSRITIIPQDPTILSGTLRSTLDVFDEYQDAEIYEALRRVHLLPNRETEETLETVNANVFRNLDSPVSEGGENFSTGEKQLLCMARAILKRSKILVMDEATASVDYATDELIGRTIRQEFAESTILTVAHRIRTIVDYDRVIFLDQGRILEFDKPKTLLLDKNSRFRALCKATGKEEFAMLLSLAGVSE